MSIVGLGLIGILLLVAIVAALVWAVSKSR